MWIQGPGGDTTLLSRGCKGLGGDTTLLSRGCKGLGGGGAASEETTNKPGSWGLHGRGRCVSIWTALTGTAEWA